MNKMKNLIATVGNIASMSNEKYEATRSELYKSCEDRGENFRKFLDNDNLFKVADDMRSEA